MSSGSQKERELRDVFYDLGGGAIRIGSSGGGTDLELPDVFGTVDGVLYACELKYVGKGFGYCRYKREEVEDLIKFAKIWDAVPCFVGRFYRDTSFYVRRHFTVERIPEFPDNKSFSIKKGKRDEYPTVEGIVNEHRDRQADLSLTTEDAFDGSEKLL